MFILGCLYALAMIIAGVITMAWPDDFELSYIAICGLIVLGPITVLLGLTCFILSLFGFNIVKLYKRIYKKSEK